MNQVAKDEESKNLNYKKTSIGLLPKDWDVLKAGEIFSNHTDKNHEGDLEVLSATQDRGIIPRSQLDIDIKYEKSSLKNYKKVEPGDFVISLRSFQGGIEYSEYEGIVSPAYTVLKNKVEIDDGFYKYLFKKEDFISRLNSVIYGIRDGKQISYTDFKNLKIQYPPIKEQQKIASILSTWDKAIELKEKLIEQKKEQKKGLMQKLLTGEVRLPGFNGEWIEVKLGDLGECIRGVSYNPKDLYLNDNQNSIRLLRSNNIQDGTLNNDDIQYVDKSIVKEKQLLRKNDLVISMANGSKKLVGKNGVFHSLSNFEYTVGAFCAIFRFNNKCSPNYAKYLFQTNKYEYFVQNLIAGSNINNLKPSDIESMKFIVPANRNEQEEIAKVIDQITNEIKLLGKEILLLKQQKKGLMQLLLTGKVRVKV